MADFCYECTIDLFGEQNAEENDFSGIVRGRERYFCLCEGCGWITVDKNGKKIEDEKE